MTWNIGIDNTATSATDRYVIRAAAPQRDIVLIKHDGRTYLYGRRVPKRLGLIIAALLIRR